MRLLIAAAISMSMLIPGAFAQDDSRAPTPSNVTLQSMEQKHPEWFKETGTYRPCPWNMCPAPR